jgi:hypothetical protein
MRYPITMIPHGRGLTPLLCLIGAVGLGACAKPKRSNPPVKTPEWQGLRIGMERKQAEKQLKDAGLRVHCSPAQNITYFDDGALYTRWAKQGQASRMVRCTARRKKGAKAGPDGVLQSKLYFLDDKMYRLHVKLLSNDQAFEQVLRARYGTLRQRKIARHAYASKKPTGIRMWILTLASTRIIWLRSGSHQQLVLFTADPAQVKALKALSSTRKGD